MTTPQPFFNFHQNINEIVLVGCGGTGAQWARAIARICFDLTRRRQHVPAIRFVDPDRIEARNCGRQMYMLRGIYSARDQIPDHNL
jgi:tRNA A37 threonylcarbamoyladenosine dehydratase